MEGRRGDSSCRILPAVLRLGDKPHGSTIAGRSLARAGARARSPPSFSFKRLRSVRALFSPLGLPLVVGTCVPCWGFCSLFELLLAIGAFARCGSSCCLPLRKSLCLSLSLGLSPSPWCSRGLAVPCASPARSRRLARPLLRRSCGRKVSLGGTRPLRGALAGSRLRRPLGVSPSPACSRRLARPLLRRSRADAMARESTKELSGDPA